MYFSTFYSEDFYNFFLSPHLYASFHTSLSLYIYLSIDQSINQYLCLSIYQSFCLSNKTSTCMSAHHYCNTVAFSPSDFLIHSSSPLLFFYFYHYKLSIQNECISTRIEHHQLLLSTPVMKYVLTFKTIVRVEFLYGT